MGKFGFSDLGGSFGGAEYVLDGWGEINRNLYYSALTGQVTRRRTASEWRIFGPGYQDLRTVY